MKTVEDRCTASGEDRAGLCLVAVLRCLVVVSVSVLFVFCFACLSRWLSVLYLFVCVSSVLSCPSGLLLSSVLSVWFCCLLSACWLWSGFLLFLGVCLVVVFWLFLFVRRFSVS